MIVFCAGMSRSASTLQYQLVKAAVEGKGLGRGVGFHYQRLVCDENEISVIKSEQPGEWMLKGLSDGSCKAVSIYRDPRDVAVSLHHFFHSRHEFDSNYRDWTQDEVIEEWLPRTMRWYQGWNSYKFPVYKYEAYYHKQWYKMLEGICEYLEIHITTTECYDIAQRFTIPKNVIRQTAQRRWIDTGDTMLTKEHISPNYGAPGAWIKKLTFKQAQLIEETYSGWMEEHGYS